MAKQNKQTKNKKGAPRKKQLKSNFPTKKEDIDDIRLHQEELWKVMKEILKRLSTI